MTPRSSGSAGEQAGLGLPERHRLARREEETGVLVATLEEEAVVLPRGGAPRGLADRPLLAPCQGQRPLRVGVAEHRRVAVAVAGDEDRVAAAGEPLADRLDLALRVGERPVLLVDGEELPALDLELAADHVALLDR